MKVRCKFKCTNIGQSEKGLHSARFVPVICGSKENETFFKYTPGGEIKLDVLNAQYFEPGKDYFIDIEEVPQPPQAV